MKIGDLVSFMPFLVASIAIPGIVVYRQLLGNSGVTSTNLTWTIGLAPLVFAIFVTLTNAQLNFSRPWLYYRRNENMDDYKFVSGIPAIGSIAVLVSSLWSPPSFWIGIIMLVTYILDTGGLLLFAVTVVAVANQTEYVSILGDASCTNQIYKKIEDLEPEQFDRDKKFKLLSNLVGMYWLKTKYRPESITETRDFRIDRNQTIHLAARSLELLHISSKSELKDLVNSTGWSTSKEGVLIDVETFSPDFSSFLVRAFNYRFNQLPEF